MTESAAVGLAYLGLALLNGWFGWLYYQDSWFKGGSRVAAVVCLILAVWILGRARQRHRRRRHRPHP